VVGLRASANEVIAAFAVFAMWLLRVDKKELVNLTDDQHDTVGSSLMKFASARQPARLLIDTIGKPGSTLVA
jgi:hypothetical protein